LENTADFFKKIAHFLPLANVRYKSIAAQRNESQPPHCGANNQPLQTSDRKLPVDPDTNVADLLAHVCEPLALANIMHWTW
jgi:hypothetical protein